MKGKRQFARTHCVHGDELSLVVLKASEVCDGLGVFTTRDVAKGVPMTTYAGQLVDVADIRNLRMTTDDYDDRYNFHIDDTVYIVGHRDVETLSGKGLAQFVNDAIDPVLSGHMNNAFFKVRRNEVFIYALRDIKAGEEVLADYHISYWLPRENDARLPYDIRQWIYCQNMVLDYLRRCVFKSSACELDDFLGISSWDEDVPEATDDTEIVTGIVSYYIYVNECTTDVEGSLEGQIDHRPCACDQPGTRLCNVRLMHNPDTKITYADWKCLDCDMPCYSYGATSADGALFGASYGISNKK
jgi:hypothetical protein